MNNIEVLRIPDFKSGDGSYCGKNWKVGDIWEYVGMAYELGYWTEDQDADDEIYRNIRTGETMNATLFHDKDVLMKTSERHFKFH